jgi:glucose-6-phosphate isomerase
MELIHQGTRLVPCDFIASIKSHNPLRGGKHHEVLLANFIAQTESLMNGYQPELNQQLHPNLLKGNRPSNSIVLPDISPFVLGALVAIYEHKVFVQSLIWDVNAYAVQAG